VTNVTSCKILPVQLTFVSVEIIEYMYYNYAVAIPDAHSNRSSGVLFERKYIEIGILTSHSSFYNISLMAIPFQMPDFLRPFFWDVDFDSLRWEAYQDFIVRRVLESGNWEAICWLRGTMGDQGLRAWLLKRKGASLDPRHLRFWQVVLRLRVRAVDRWVASIRYYPWSDRVAS
jgi:hypothetical protein